MSQAIHPENWLDGVKIWAESISGQWDGDNSGIEEDRATVAEDIVETVTKLEELIEELKELE
jgi:hypothetical protein